MLLDISLKHEYMLSFYFREAKLQFPFEIQSLIVNYASPNVKFDRYPTEYFDVSQNNRYELFFFFFPIEIDK